MAAAAEEQVSPLGGGSARGWCHDQEGPPCFRRGGGSWSRKVTAVVGGCRGEGAAVEAGCTAGSFRMRCKILGGVESTALFFRPGG